MAQVLVDMAISLDGFVADRDGNSLYPIDELRNTKDLGDLITSTGAVVMGKRAYEMAKGDFTGYEYQVPIFVVTHRAPQTPAKGLTFSFVTDGCESAVEKAKAAAASKNVMVIGGASTAQQCLRAGVVDSLILRIVPVLLGDGLPLFDHAGNQRLEVEGRRVSEPSQITHLQLRILR